MKNFVLEKRKRGRIQGLPKFLGTPIIPGTGKATDFKFCQYIPRVHPNKSPLKILEKRERGRIQGLPIFFGYPLLSQEREKLRISNLASTFRGSIRTAPYGLPFHKVVVCIPPKTSIAIFGEKGAWAYPGTEQFFRTGPGKATHFKFCVHIYRLNRNKSTLKILGKVAMGVRSQVLPKNFRASIHTAHRAVIFAIAQLSCCCYGLSTNTTMTFTH